MTSTYDRPIQLSVICEGAMFPPNEQYRMIDVARQAEELGIEFIDTTDHVIMGSVTPPHHGWLPEHLDMPQPEPLTVLAAMAGATKRIKLLSGIVIAPLRPAGLLAKTAATLHALSRGRFVMGVSTSWQKDEYDLLGVSFEKRGQILEDEIGACRALWEHAPASFQSPTISFSGMYCQPRPARGERIPVWFGGKPTARLIRRVVTLGDGWMPYGGLGMSVSEKAEAIQTLRERFADAGRDPSGLDVCDHAPEVEGSLGKTMEQIPELAEIGVNVFRVHLRRFARSAQQVPTVLEEVAKRFSEYRSLRA